LRDAPEFLIAASPKLDDSSLATPLGDRASSGQRLNVAGGRKAITVVPELDQQAGSQEITGPGQGIKDESVRVLFEELTQLGLGLVALADLRKKELGQNRDVISVCVNNGRIGCGCRLNQVRISPRDEVWSRIVLLTAEGFEGL
jgi:hypothetical protein